MHIPLFFVKEKDKIWMVLWMWGKLPTIEKASHKCPDYKNCRSNKNNVVSKDACIEALHKVVKQKKSNILCINKI